MTEDDDLHSEIPPGTYCYFGSRAPESGYKPCPHWGLNADKPEQRNGHCNFLKKGDWETEGLGLLWDQVKECGINQ